MSSFVLGYDPGGNGRHGVALLGVYRNGVRWDTTGDLRVNTCETANAAMSWFEEGCGNARIVAAGIDTLTAWCSSRSGLRPADIRLRKTANYALVRSSVDNPNHINGSMAINGAIIVKWIKDREGGASTITEAHPKVCYFALRGRRHPWAKTDEKNPLRPAPDSQSAARSWLAGELNVTSLPVTDFDAEDHGFDAAMGVLGALRGLNREWTIDLHAEVTSPTNAQLIHPFGQTYFFWPDFDR